ncbi:LOW QUALITY PROTEIN: fatty-acid amide hydrolase 1-like [Pollicipes pollicipes]|uniref:LOW QUALITY PROTEIN: fatty-acid amide hydrolase 1-like n=1 Tax=Pollicipes pollicipes TaxID=41117 RepID=UPI001884CD8C|nr:LOW QUALITY PROTEIN: fatty-acid amide hydrolase 1-like [Pollicipes pollicipes]
MSTMTDSMWNLWVVGASCAAISGMTLLWWLKKRNSAKPEYYARVERRLELERQRRVQLTKHLLVDGNLITEERMDILELPLLQLIEQLQVGQLKAVLVLRAYQAKALQASAKYNCVTEFVATAESRASVLDRLPAAARGPLHGLPFSVKDCVDLEGYDSTAGLAKHLGQPASRSAPVVETLIDLGGVPFCKTNVPQTMISFGCSNPVWGVTTNIYDGRRVPGGSSGGEGVLVAAGGSPLGVGTDVGGSVRVPALFSGCYGFKPTCGRLSCVGLRAVLPATFGVRATVGFLSREIAGLQKVMELLTSPLEAADMYRLDPLVPRVYWNSQMAGGRRRWRVGYVADLPTFPSTPGCRRVLTETVQALEAAGHETAPFHLEADHAAMDISCGRADEEVDKSIETLVAMLRVPRWLRVLIAWGTSNNFRYLGTRLKAWTGTTVEAVQLKLAWNQLVDRTLKQWRAARLDLLVLPGFMCPAPPHDMISNLVVGGVYTSIFNVLNFPAGVVNVGHETAEDQTALEEYPTPHVELRWVVEATRGALGQPLGVQVVGLPWMEEQVLAGMAEVERALAEHKQ